MKLYSQRDPAYKNLKLANKLTIGSHGCFVASMATLFQKPIEEILKIKNAIDKYGNLNSAIVAKACGGAALTATTTPPDGWCIAVTNQYAPTFPTHFFLCNPKLKKQIDPLDFPCAPEKLSYPVIEYRPFTGIKLNIEAVPPQGVFPDVEVGRWSEDAIKFCKDNAYLLGGDDGLFRPTAFLTREELAVVIKRIFSK